MRKIGTKKLNRLKRIQQKMNGLVVSVPNQFIGGIPVAYGHSFIIY